MPLCFLAQQFSSVSNPLQCQHSNFSLPHQRFAGSHPDKWDYSEANIPILTKEMEIKARKKNLEKRRKKKEAQKLLKKAQEQAEEDRKKKQQQKQKEEQERIRRESEAKAKEEKLKRAQSEQLLNSSTQQEDLESDEELQRAIELSLQLCNREEEK